MKSKKVAPIFHQHPEEIDLKFDLACNLLLVDFMGKELSAYLPELLGRINAGDRPCFLHHFNLGEIVYVLNMFIARASDPAFIKGIDEDDDEVAQAELDASVPGSPFSVGMDNDKLVLREVPKVGIVVETRMCVIAKIIPPELRKLRN